MPDYRAVPEERRETFQRYVRYAFQPQRGYEGIEEELEEDAFDWLGDLRALFDGDEMVSVCAHHWFTARLRGDWHEVPGLSAVATPPEHRHQGLIRSLLTESIAEYRDRGSHFSALWPFEFGFYRKFGWAMANRYATVELPPDQLAFAADEDAGSFVPVEADDWERLARVYDAYREPYALTIDRTEDWWRKRVFRGFETDPYVYAWERDGEARAYLVYRIEERDDGEGKRLSAWESAWVDDEAYRALLRYCYYHDAQVETVRFYGPPDPSLVDRVPDPRAADVEVHPGAMFRVVDVAAGLSALDYPTDATARLALAVSDPLVEDNDGTFVLDVGDGTADCYRDDDADPDVELDVNALSQLVAGYRPVDHLARTANLAGDADALDRLGTVFPSEPVLLGERF